MTDALSADALAEEPTATHHPSPRDDSVGSDVLAARCFVLEQSVRNSATATAEQINAARPGGQENPDTSAQGWLYFFGQLSRWHALGPQQQSKPSLRWDDRGIADLRAALHATPVEFTLDSGARATCYPKGERAIAEVMHNQLSLQWVTARKLALMEVEQTPSSLETLGLAIEAEEQLVAEFAAIVTHPGADLPWMNVSRWDRDVPAFTRSLTTFDLVSLRRAYVECNLSRVNAVAERTRDFVTNGDSMPLEAFIGTLSADLQVQPERLVREWSRGETFALALTRFEAQERAKAKAEANAPAGER